MPSSSAPSGPRRSTLQVVSKELREERAAEIAAEMGEAEKPQETLRVRARVGRLIEGLRAVWKHQSPLRRQLARLQRLQSRLRRASCHAQFKTEELSGCFTREGVSAGHGSVRRLEGRGGPFLHFAELSYSTCRTLETLEVHGGPVVQSSSDAMPGGIGLLCA